MPDRRSPPLRCDHGRRARVALAALIAACGPDKTADSADASTSSASGPSSDTATSGPPWPATQCGDGVCEAGRICVVDWYWECCTFRAASTTSDSTSTTGAGTTDAGTSTGTTGMDTSTGSGSGPNSGSTGAACQETSVTTYKCVAVPPSCSADDPSLVECLDNQLCQGFGPVEFSAGVLDCPGPNHGCY